MDARYCTNFKIPAELSDEHVIVDRDRHNLVASRHHCRRRLAREIERKGMNYEMKVVEIGNKLEEDINQLEKALSEYGTIKQINKIQLVYENCEREITNAQEDYAHARTNWRYQSLRQIDDEYIGHKQDEIDKRSVFIEQIRHLISVYLGLSGKLHDTRMLARRTYISTTADNISAYEFVMKNLEQENLA